MHCLPNKIFNKNFIGSIPQPPIQKSKVITTVTIGGGKGNLANRWRE
jgi:hypothetical protein